MGETTSGHGAADELNDSNSWKWLLAAAGVLVIGVASYFAITALVPEPEPKTRGPVGSLVEVAFVEEGENLTLAQTGFVTSAATLTLSSEVTGRVATIAEDFRVGRRVASGTVLVELDRARFEAEASAARARLGGAEARRDRARSTLERQQRLDDGGFASEARLEEASTALASAEAEVDLARSQLDLASIALRDAVIRAPYDALVAEREISLGQIVGPGTAVGSLVRADSAEIELGLLPRQRRLLENDGPLVGRAVEVRRPNEDASINTGSVVAIDPVLDPVARTLDVVVVIDDPFGSVDDSGSEAVNVLRVGELVEVLIPVTESSLSALRVPARALKGDDRLWQVTDDNTLRSVRPRIIRRNGDTVLVTADELAAGDRLLLTEVATAVDGLTVRVAGHDGGDAHEEVSTSSASKASSKAQPQ